MSGVNHNLTQVRLSSDPKYYNRVQCEVCLEAVKVHFLRRHCQTLHNLSLSEYRIRFGAGLKYVGHQTYHGCGLCGETLLFDLDTIHSHVRDQHGFRVREYVDRFLSSRTVSKCASPNQGPVVDADGAPVLSLIKTNSGTERKQLMGMNRNVSMADILTLSDKSIASDRPRSPTKKRARSTSTETVRVNDSVTNCYNTETDDGVPNCYNYETENGGPTSYTYEAEDGVSPGLVPDCYNTKLGDVDVVPNCYKSGYLERCQDRDEEGNLISNDFADYVEVACQICGLNTPMTRLRSHTKSAHGTTITEYKMMFGADLTPLQLVYHRCGICGDLVVLDSDHVAVHLKKPGHNISHKNYNEGFMVDTRGSRFVRPSLPRPVPDRVPQQPRTTQPAPQVRGRRAPKPAGVYDEADYDLHLQHQTEEEETEVVPKDEQPLVSHSLQVSGSRVLDVILLNDDEEEIEDTSFINYAQNYEMTSEHNSNNESQIATDSEGNENYESKTEENIRGDLVDTVDIGVFVDISS